jgi:hypothetical protein
LLDRYRPEIQSRAGPKRTICEVLRELWDIAAVIPQEDLAGELRARILTAYDMAKRMNRKLREYRHDWDEGFWSDNEDLEQDLKRRSKRL